MKSDKKTKTFIPELIEKLDFVKKVFHKISNINAF